MGAYASLSENVDCYTVDEIIVGAQTTVSQGTKLCTAGHDITSRIMELPIKVSIRRQVRGSSPPGDRASPADACDRARHAASSSISSI